jgi:hypothetical protein
MASMVGLESGRREHMEVRNWAKVASQARARASQLKFGTRDVGLEQIANELKIGWTAHTMRRALSALDATERLQAEAELPAAELQSFPLAAVEHAARLYRRDPVKGKQEILKLIAGQTTVAELQRLEAKGHAPDRETGQALRTRHRKSIANVIRTAILAELRVHVTLNARASEIKRKQRKPGEDPLAIADFVSTEQAPDTSIPVYGPFEPVRLAVVMVGPYNDKSRYRNRAFEWTARAIALLVVYRRVVLVLPHDCPDEPFLFWRATLRLSDDTLLLLKLHSDGTSVFLEDRLSGRPI